MADDKVALWGDSLKFGRSPASGELLVGNGSGFDLTASNVTWGNPIEFSVPIKVIGQVWSTTTGFKFPDNTVQTTAASSYAPPSVANNTIISNVSGGSASPAANTLTQVLDATAGNAQGSIIYRSASAWTVLAPGTAGQILATGGASANPSWSSAAAITYGTSVAVSGTAVDFTGIPSTAKRVTVLFSGVSTSGSSSLLIQIGSGSFQTSGYSSQAGNDSSNASSTAGFIVTDSNASNATPFGMIQIMERAASVYVSSGVLAAINQSASFSAGGVSLSGVLDRVRITTVNGTDTFDAGDVNIAWEE
jgi:hypothetical protein